MCRERLVLLVLCGLLSGPGRADAPALLDHELGAWLEREAAPELAETLARHPRFKGETVQLAAFSPGAGEAASNGLTRAVERRLRQLLLTREGVRLAAETEAAECRAPRPVAYLLRVEVTSAGARNGRVHVGVIDVAESLWVSGVSYTWQGRLTTAEIGALSRPVMGGRPGSPGNPIALTEADRVAAALKADLRCMLPWGLDGGLYVASPEPGSLARVASALRSELMLEPLAVMTAEPSEAGWLLAVEADDAGVGVQELALILTHAVTEQRQRVGSVFVVGTAGAADHRGPGDPGAAKRAGAAPPEPPVAAVSALLSPLRMEPAAPRGICDSRRARVNSCVEIGFELLEPAYLFVLSTQTHRLAEAPCGGSLERARAGPRRFRLRVPPAGYAVSPGSAGPDGGFYVLAVRDRGHAAALQAVLAEAPGMCGRGSLATSRWLGELAAVLGELGHRVEWRALHLAHDTTGIVAL